MDLLRFSTAGSVDDGKSTLIGRLLFDAKSIFEDQYDSLVRTTARRGGVGRRLGAGGTGYWYRVHPCRSVLEVFRDAGTKSDQAGIGRRPACQIS